MHFIKMHGIGNDYVYVDRFLYDAPKDVDAAAVKVSDRHTGIGSDGLILIEPSEVADCRMNMRNADGSVSKMCGNAMRCIGKYMLERHPERCHGDVVRIETLGGIKAVQAVERDENGAVTLLRVDMEAPGFAAESIPVLADDPQDVPLRIGDKPARGVCVSMGNPHVVFLVDEDPMGLEPFDVEPIRALCGQINVPYTVLDTEIAHIIFDVRKESNPCALCAKMRRGALNDAAVAAGCNKVALGHHREDAIETLLMSLIFEGRLHTFHPNTYLSRRNITVIRPMVYVPEKHVIHMVRTLDLPVVKNPCPADGNSKREEIKELIASLCKTYPHLKDYMLSALQNTAQYGLWDQKQAGGAPAVPPQQPDKEE